MDEFFGFLLEGFLTVLWDVFVEFFPWQRKAKPKYPVRSRR